jgi:DNA polymerase I
MTSDRILIVDGLNTFLRTWSVVPEMDSNGDPIGGVIGSLRSIKCVMRDACPTKVVVAWDGKGGSQKRRGIFAEYKAGRKPRVNREYSGMESYEESQRNLRTQYLKLREYLSFVGVHQIEIEGTEADDVVGYLCRQVYDLTDKVVVSTDKDFLQLVDSHTIVYSPTMKLYYTAPVVREKWMVLPENFVYLKALMGDPSDNIRGIGGVGPKTAVKLFPFLAERPSSIDEIVEHARANENKNPKYRSIIAGRELLIGNVQLMQLSTPTIGAQSAMAIRHALEKEEAKFVMSELKIAFLRDGIQLKDSDFFQVFNEYRLRSQQQGVSKA